MQEQVQISGVTRDDIQRIIQDTIKDLKIKPSVIFLDASYAYNFHPSDFYIVSKLCKLIRYNKKNAIEWHRLLERWYQDQTVIINGIQIKPYKIARCLDRVPNEALEATVGAWIGTENSTFKWHGLGSGETSQALPSDTQLVNQISRIDVTEDPNGGSVSRDGSTLYVVGNHPISVETADITESGVFDSESTSNDIMLDHAVFDDEIDHIQNADVPGSSTIIYTCSS
jgi:hypothetical protein